jgi:hypothetical protein
MKFEHRLLYRAEIEDTKRIGYGSGHPVFTLIEEFLDTELGQERRKHSDYKNRKREQNEEA